MGVLGLLAWNLTDILPLLIIAALLSYLLFPLVSWIEKRVLFVLPFRARSLAVLLAFLVVLSAFVLVLVLIVPVLIDQIAQIGRGLPGFLEQAEDDLVAFLSEPIRVGGRIVPIGGRPIIPMDVLEDITGNTEEGINLVQAGNFDIFEIIGTFVGSVGGLTGPAFSVLGGALDVLFNLVFLVVIMFYLMRDGEFFSQELVKSVPDAYKGDVRRLMYELGRVWDAYLRGQLLLCLIIGFAVYIAALLLGVPNAPILGLIAGLLEFIPNLGPLIALIPAAFLALVSESGTVPFLSGIPFALVVIVVWTGIQQLESIFLVPRVMGGSLNLHPVVVILAVIAGASLAGALGVILAAPFTASARLLGQYIYGKVFDTDPFPPKVRPKPVKRRALPSYNLRRFWRRRPVEVSHGQD
ncbi:MAG: hypothetical protein OHK0046_29930 [Anaerolineae bacterium]